MSDERDVPNGNGVIDLHWRGPLEARIWLSGRLVISSLHVFGHWMCRCAK
jgi:hypothetical protein